MAVGRFRGRREGGGGVHGQSGRPESGPEFGPGQGPLIEVMAVCPKCGSRQYAQDGSYELSDGKLVIYRKCLDKVADPEHVGKEKACGYRGKVIRVTTAQVFEVRLKTE